MTATEHSHRSYLVIDPVQDYEQSDVVLGVYGSLKAALIALPRLRRIRNSTWGRSLNDPRPSGYLEVQHWHGDEHRTTVQVRNDGHMSYEVH
ncbi:hypothetical protein SEA_GALADRIEL_84 [Gordonia phage Galadriel]|uniref:Uncharacterized protein n=5 Tax=Vividuovirus TaxID=2560251 RepID=A0A142K9Y6_9CAUD|nr:hypothetical protein BJD57_gp87 [Gordonia phage Vivi2]YP_010096875.1 hypothetical protein KNT97_gp83 [Gordonia phage Rofo]YP_010099328.1 hypothetical protein KNU19_gp85 [Gordonia phage Fosterous]YP_010099665.1 hypothetical protein KNU23_gp86 [Gordonia phage Tangent]YP_010102912.1 hypothetical protein KNU61_gp84 [Gordonia phage Galadriel]QDH92726.1 hypothetical protein SEA_CHARMING_86 [Gordonia phage Charming]AMS02919.1 hypothetical protein SEA_VIVI2_87 [Gordonia phage Vivi2]AXH46660.1 hyp